LHRDIKPSNLMLDARGTVWVTDFGLAKSDDAGALTQTGDVVGTLRYMAPDRFDGWSDPRSDVYSLGATLYELLTLRPPFDEQSRVRLIQQVMRDSPVPPRRVDRNIPRDLETIVLKA
jgi:serine/threonine protein kinase